MRNLYKITNIALIFMLIEALVCQNIAYASDISHLRVPIGIDEDKAADIIEHLGSKDAEAGPVDYKLDLDIKWVTRKIYYNHTQVAIPSIMTKNIAEVVLDINNDFLRKTISNCLKNKIRLEKVEKIKRMEIELFQKGEYNHIFRATTFLGTKEVIFGLVIVNDSSLNRDTKNDFVNICSLREQFPRFSDLLQNPYVLDDSASLTMFSCEWFDDYYELGINWNNNAQGTTFYINDPRISVPPRGINSSPSVFKFTKEEIAAIVEEISRMLTIFFDEEKQRSIDLSQIRIEAGDFTHYKKVSTPKLKLMTVRNIKKNQGVNDFITALMNLEDDVTGGLLGLFSFGPAFSNYRESVAKGILRGLQDKHGKEQGKERFSIWCDNCPLLESAAISLTTALSSSPSLSSNRKGFTDSPQSDQSLASNQGVEKGRRKVKGSQAQLGDKGAMHPLQNKASESGDTLYLGMIEYTPKEIEELLDLVGDKTDQKKTFRRA